MAACSRGHQSATLAAAQIAPGIPLMPWRLLSAAANCLVTLWAVFFSFVGGTNLRSRVRGLFVSEDGMMCMCVVRIRTRLGQMGFQQSSTHARTHARGLRTDTRREGNGDSTARRTSTYARTRFCARGYRTLSSIPASLRGWWWEKLQKGKMPGGSYFLPALPPSRCRNQKVSSSPLPCFLGVTSHSRKNNYVDEANTGSVFSQMFSSGLR